MYASTETRRGHGFRRLISGLVAVLGMAFASLAIITTTAPAAQADSCYTWNSTLSESRDSSGSAVKELQIRVAGWAGYGKVLSIDGDYGPNTTTAVKRFQQAYGLTADGVAGSRGRKRTPRSINFRTVTAALHTSTGPKSPTLVRAAPAASTAAAWSTPRSRATC